MVELRPLTCDVCGKTSQDSNDFQTVHMCKACYNHYCYLKNTFMPKIANNPKAMAAFEDEFKRYDECYHRA